MRKKIKFFTILLTLFSLENTIASSRLIPELSQKSNSALKYLRRTPGHTPANQLDYPKSFDDETLQKSFPKKVMFLDNPHEFYKSLSNNRKNINIESCSFKEENDHTIVVNLKNEQNLCDIQGTNLDSTTNKHSIVSSPFKFLDFQSIDMIFDKRIYIPDSHVFPWSVHGYVTCSFPGYGFCSRGTGTMIGKDSVITAAHCLYYYDKKLKKHIPASEVNFFSGMQGREKYTFSVKCKKFFVHPEYLNDDENFDFGVLTLEEDIGFKTGWASLVAPENDSELTSKIVAVTGYPASKGVLKTMIGRPSYDMYTMQGPITSVKKHKLYYHIDTSGGQSGSGVWVLNDKQVECIGIHVTGSKDEGNGAIRITPDNIDVIEEWMSITSKE